MCDLSLILERRVARGGETRRRKVEPVYDLGLTWDC